MTLKQELWLDARHHIKMLSLFVTALVPAWVILLIRYAFSADANLEIALLLVPLIAAVPAVVIRYLQRAALANTDLVHIHVKKKSDITGEVALYTLAYIPVVLFEDFAPANLLTLLTIMVVIYAMYVRFNLLHVNPVVSLFYRTYRVVDNHGNTVVVLAKLKVRVESTLPCRELSDGLYMVTSDDL